MPRINFFDCSITVFEYSSVWLAAVNKVVRSFGNQFELCGHHEDLPLGSGSRSSRQSPM